MGMGEPLANYDRVWAAVERLHDDLGLSARHLTRLDRRASCPASAAWPPSDLPVNLAVSLHAANDELRDELVPDQPALPARRARWRPARDYLAAKGRRLSFEWALIDGVNDRAGRRRASWPTSAARCRSRAHVNLIPLNPTPGWPTRGTPADRVRGLPRPPAPRSASTPPSAATAAPTSTPPAASWPPGSR